jgi:hypothetical protein
MYPSRPWAKSYVSMTASSARTHLVDLLYIWMAHHGGGHADSRDIVVDLNSALKPLSETHAGERWRVSVALGASETRAPGAKLVAAGDTAAAMDFGALSVNVY